jgi:hypothetical protein
MSFKTISLIFIAFLTGFILSILLFKKSREITAGSIPVAVQEKAAKKVNAAYEKKMELLRKKETEINIRLLASRTKLAEARMKNKNLLDELTVLTNNPSLNKDSNAAPVESNHVIKQKFTTLVLSESVKDSLCDEAISAQSQLLANKDSVISISEQQIKSFKKLQEDGLVQQNILLADNSLLKKKAKKLKHRNGLLKAVAIAISLLMLSPAIK